MKLDAKTRSKVVALLRRNIPNQEIADRCDIAQSTVWSIAVSEGLRLPEGHAEAFAKLDARRTELDRLFEISPCVKTAARKMRVSEPALMNYCKQRGIERVSRRESYEERERKAYQFARLTLELFHKPLNALRV